MDWRRPWRRRVVSEEPFALAPEVSGRELASIPRRVAAILVDGLLWMVLAVALLVGLALGALWWQAPNLVRAFVGTSSEEGRPARSEQVVAELLVLVERRLPGTLPEPFTTALADGDVDTLAEVLEEEEFELMVDLGDAGRSYYDGRTGRLHVHGDVIFGPLSSVFSFAATALLYFVPTLRIGEGRTPGKWLAGIRVLRYDGRPLTLWDAFGRAGGYTASLSTLGLGFVEAVWDPNRRALHDRVAGTVVVREARPKPWRRRRRR